MSAQDDDSDKTHEPTPRKLEQARKKGEIARSADLNVAAAYTGVLLAAILAGTASLQDLGNTLLLPLDRASSLAPLVFEGSPNAALAPVGQGVVLALLPWFLLPALIVLVTILSQRAFVVTPSKIAPKLSRISLVSNARNKYGRAGLFEFAKSFTKLLVYSAALAIFLKARLAEMIMSVRSEPGLVSALMGRLVVDFLFAALLIALGIGAIDFLFQRAEHMRKNRMSRKELMDETKEAEGDPHMKQERRQRGREIANAQMLQDVATADVVIVNPTHFAVALKWSRKPGEAPVCIAKGVDEIARRMREIASQNGVPLHSDPPVARALFATVEIGQEIPPNQYRAVAAAIRFAESMRKRAWRRRS